MSQTPQGKCAADEVPELLFFAHDAHVDGQQNVYIVVALSQRKQSQIMKTVGQVHCENQPFPTWDLVGQALSEALFKEQGRLKLKSTMELYQKDYLLFERNFEGCVSKSSTAPFTESILEIDFGRQSDGLTWLEYWKIARPVVAKFVKNSIKNLARLSEPDHPQLNGRLENGGIEKQGTTDGKNKDLDEEAGNGS
ncbi:hypothetical protein B7494_g5160 [Chlorociboria aeruginascens]|nr:hypothetical protein B7494_g5160 [Chlorociboria aeruginascens]